MAEVVTEELKTQVLEYFKQKNKMLTSRDVSKWGYLYQAS